jgi:RNA-binding protein 26
VNGHTPAGGYRPYRGRGRGAARGFYARGGAAARGVGRASMKLDNRPKVLRVSGVPADSMQGVQDWFEVGFWVVALWDTLG